MLTVMFECFLSQCKRCKLSGLEEIRAYLNPVEGISYRRSTGCYIGLDDLRNCCQNGGHHCHHISYQMRTPQLSLDQLFFDSDGTRQRYLVAGVDEAGRGPLAGNVFAAAVILDPDQKIDGLADSKVLTEQRREELAEEIRSKAVAYCVAQATVEEIDHLNILHASMLAMARAIEGLPTAPNHCMIDGNRCPVTRFNCQAIVKGDSLVQEISAASILAKVDRDHSMLEFHDQYPQYGFDSNKGYPTRTHIDALEQHGALDIHRRTFGPVRKCLAAQVTTAATANVTTKTTTTTRTTTKTTTKTKAGTTA